MPYPASNSIFRFLVQLFFYLFASGLNLCAKSFQREKDYRRRRKSIFPSGKSRINKTSFDTSRREGIIHSKQILDDPDFSVADPVFGKFWMRVRFEYRVGSGSEMDYPDFRFRESLIRINVIFLTFIKKGPQIGISWDWIVVKIKNVRFLFIKTD